MKAWNWATRTTESHFSIWLAAIIALTHLWGLLAFGATFWVDSTICVGVGEALWPPANLRAFFDLPTTLMYSHVGLGESVLWRLVCLLPANWSWPALALTQHVSAGVALWYCVVGLHRCRPSRWHLGAAAALCLLPFYQSLHNAVLTESIASSALLFGLGAIVRLDSRPAFFVLLGSLIVAAQFRVPTALALGTMAGISLLLRWRRVPIRWWLMLAGASVTGLAIFPLYRWWATGTLVAPTGGTNRLVCSFWANPNLSSQAQSEIKKLDWPAFVPLESIRTSDFDYASAAEVGIYWTKAGLSLPQIVKRVDRISALVLSDSPRVRLMQLRLGLVSSGFSQLAFLGSSDEPVFHLFSLREFREHAHAHYTWLSWIAHDSYFADGRDSFDGRHYAIPNAKTARRQLWKRIEPHISAGSARLRDPLFLGKLPLDVWALVGMCAIALCGRFSLRLGLVLFLPVLINVAVTGFFPLGGVRYAYTLVPLYFLASGLAAASICQAASTRQTPV